MPDTPDTLPSEPQTAVAVADANATPMQSQTQADTQAAPAAVSNANPTSQTAPQSAQQPSVQKPAQSASVGNTPAKAAPAQTDPAITHASRFYQFAQALAGGPRFTTAIDPSTGATTRTQVRLSHNDIGMAIAMEAISGALGGLAQSGPNATANAATGGFQQGQQQIQQRKQQDQQQAQEEFQNQASALARKASVYEANSRAILNTSEAEAKGADAIDKLVSINRQSGVLDVDPSSVDNSGQPMTQTELMSALQSGSISATDHLGPVAGRVEVTKPDGSKAWETTHLVIRDPNAKVSLSQETWDRFAAGGVKGFPAGTKIGGDVKVPLRMVQNANEQLASHTLANGRLSDLKDALEGTQFVDKVPASIDFTKPGVDTAMQHFQKYVSHNADNLGDPYLAIQSMGADKRDPKTGEMQPNPDAKWVPAIVDAFGGSGVLQAAHNEILNSKATAASFSVIDSQNKAEAVLAAPKRFTKDQISAASRFVQIAQNQSIGKAVSEARAHAVATGADFEAMLKTGINPLSREKLTLQNAPDSMLVDPNGNVVPQNQQTLYKPTSQQKQTADTARQVLAISADLQAQVANNPALIGPLSGNSAKAFAPLGIGTEAAQKMLDNVSLLQSAITRMHTGRFSSEVMRKSGSLISPGMNTDQFGGAMDSIRDVAGRYANEDQLQTVASFRQQQASQPSRNVVPSGATPGRDAKGVIVGYKGVDGKVVRF